MPLMLTCLPLLRRLFFLLLAASLALPPLVANASVGASAEQGTPRVEHAEGYVPPCHGAGAGLAEAHAGSAGEADCSQLCLWLCAHANALAAGVVASAAAGAPEGPAPAPACLLHGPVRVVPLRPPIA
ncbi:MAG: hypothetical protein MEQ07_03420 [Aquimonas sp.]|nr:hypothetical protein [Aquimonas sp.]